LTTKLDIKLSI